MLEQEWWKYLGIETRQSPYHRSPRGEVSLKQATDYLASRGITRQSTKPTPKQTDIPFTAIGQAAGAAIGFTAYVWTYPIVWIDGPLPIVDTLWIGGLAMATARGAKMGRDAGRKLDTIEEVLL